MAERQHSPRTSYWLWSRESHTVIPNHMASGWCAVNGLIWVQHGDMLKGKRAVSRIGIVDKIANKETGQSTEHRDQASVYRSLKAAIKRDLVFASIHDFKNGRTAEDDSYRLMTSAAAELASAGFFDRMPGRRLR